jgi:3-methylcrotonyl-CoA carboxylase alpha subunit
MPSPGDILLYSPPKGKNIRVDSSLDGPEKISGNYDPMIAKLIVWGENRVAAIDASVSALENFHIQGIMNNMVFLRHILSLNDFRENKISTAFCDVMMQEISQAMHLEKRSISRDWVVIALIVKELYSKNYKKNVWNEIGYWRHMMTFNVFVDDQSLRVEILDKRKDITQCKINGIGYKVEFVGREDLAWRIRINDETVQFFASDDAKGKTVISIQSIDFYAFRQDKLLHGINFGEKEAGSFIGKIVSPMPGKVIKLNVKSGELVSKNQVLMIVEAMKMENNILAPYDGQVDDVYIVENQMVDTETELIVLSEKISD